jgi:mannose-1-phosphate guanylyltransferase
VKTAASAIYANKQYLEHYRKSDGKCQFATERGDQPKECEIRGNVYIHPTAKVDSSAVIGPNVSIMENCIIGPGVRIKDSIILKNALIHKHSIILCSIVGWDCNIGSWARIEGRPGEPDPNQRFAKVQNPPLFNPDGKLNPSICVLGSNVKVSGCTVILNTIVLPHKVLSRGYKNEIVL